MKLSIIIVNWNCAAYLQSCLQSLFSNRPNIDFEVLVVDNHSADESRSILYSFPEVRVIANEYNYGFAIANNQAYRHASGQFVMTLNPDTILAGDTINKLIEVLQAEPDIGLVAPVTLEGMEVELPSWDLRLFPSSRFAAIFRPWLGQSPRKCDHKQSPQGNIEVSWIRGTGYVCRRAALTGNRFFDESAFLFSEELYLCQSIRNAGYRLVIVPTAQLRHHKSVTFKRDPKRLFRAHTLMVAGLWKAKRDFYGWLAAFISTLYLCTDTFATWLVLSTKYWIFKESDSNKRLLLIELSSFFVSSFFSVALGETYFRYINRKAIKFFNDGAEPSFPPATTFMNSMSESS